MTYESWLFKSCHSPFARTWNVNMRYILEFAVLRIKSSTFLHDYLSTYLHFKFERSTYLHFKFEQMGSDKIWRVKVHTSSRDVFIRECEESYYGLLSLNVCSHKHCWATLTVEFVRAGRNILRECLSGNSVNGDPSVLFLGPKSTSFVVVDVIFI